MALQPAREPPAALPLSSLCGKQQLHLAKEGRKWPIENHAITKMRWHDVGAAWVQHFFADAHLTTPHYDVTLHVFIYIMVPHM